MPIVDRAGAVGRVHAERLGRHVLDQVGEDAKVGRAPRDVDVPGEGARLSRVGDLGAQEFVEARVDAVRYLVQQARPLVRRHLPPGSVERPPRRLHGGIHVGLAGFVHQGHEAAVDGIDILERPAQAAFRISTVDKVPHDLVRHGCLPAGGANARGPSIHLFVYV